VFKYNKSPGTFGKCDACYTTTILKIKCPCNKMFYCDLACKKKDERYHLSNCEYENRVDNQTLESLSFQPEDGARRGVVGLYNLGNTCFMNSALQCLSNTWPLTAYFLGCHFKSEVNMVNPLGTQGKLAFQYARLLNELWNKGSDTFSPNSLKNAVGEKNTMFQGYS
jgi:ubiquitin carboxyl-terminal hydrolase 4/11/15